MKNFTFCKEILTHCAEESFRELVLEDDEPELAGFVGDLLLSLSAVCLLFEELLTSEIFLLL